MTGMKTKSSFNHWLVIVLTISPLVYLAIIWNSIPEIVPVHYDAHFKADKMGTKNNVWLLSGVFSGISILLYLLFMNLRKFDPKLRKIPPSGTFTRLATVMVLFFTAMNFLFITSINNNIRLLDRAMLPDTADSAWARTSSCTSLPFLALPSPSSTRKPWWCSKPPHRATIRI